MKGGVDQEPCLAASQREVIFSGPLYPHCVAQWIRQEDECFSFSFQLLCGMKFCQQSWQANER